MRDLDKSKVYYLGNLNKEQKRTLVFKLNEVSENWSKSVLIGEEFLHFDGCYWYQGTNFDKKERETFDAIYLFETDIEEHHSEHKEGVLKDAKESAREVCEYVINLVKENGLKESDNKLRFELDFDFIEAMAKRIESETKYPPYNWQKPIDKEELINALFRHSVEVKKGKFEDNEDEYGHLIAIACNAMFIYYQLKNN